MMKALLIATLMLTPVMAEAKGKKTKSDTPVAVVVTPKPAPAPAPKPATSTFMQQQIAKAQARPQVNPLANCTYCGAYAASVGDFATVEAIGQ
jgi:hypothetical protein